MGKTEFRRPSRPRTWTREWSPAQDWSHDDAAVLDRDDDHATRDRQPDHRHPGRVERSSWHDEGVVSDYHTD